MHTPRSASLKPAHASPTDGAPVCYKGVNNARMRVLGLLTATQSGSELQCVGPEKRTCKTGAAAVVSAHSLAAPRSWRDMDALERFGEPTGDALLSEDESATDGSPATPPGTVPRQRVVDYSACRLWNAIAERTQLRIDSENVAYRLEVRGGEEPCAYTSLTRAPAE